MKKLFLSLAVASSIAAGSAMAQISVGAGYLNQTTSTTVLSNTAKGSSNGFYAGADFSCPIVAGLSVDPGVYYGLLMSKDDIFGLGFMTGDTQSHYLYIPVNIRYNFHVLDFLDVFAFAGPRFNVGLASSTTWKVLDIEHKTDNYGEDSSLQRFDLALGAGIGVDLFQTIRIKFGYDWGMLDINKTDEIKTVNSGWHIGAAFLF